MLMFEAFENMYALLRDGADPDSEVYRTTMAAAEATIRKHGKDPETVGIRSRSLVDELEKL